MQHTHMHTHMHTHPIACVFLMDFSQPMNDRSKATVIWGF